MNDLNNDDLNSDDINSDERRKHSRVEFATRVVIQIEAEETLIELKGSSKDLSLKGMFIGTKSEFAIGTKCLVKVYLTGAIDEIELIMQGSIVRQGEQNIGIEFNSMDVDTYSHLKNIVKYNN